MIRKCIGCGKDVDLGIFKSRDEGQEILNGDVVCKSCCELVGIPLGMKGAFVASTYNKERFLKKYIKIKPESKYLLDECKKEKQKQKEELRKELETRNIRKNCKEKTEEKYTCERCGAVWYNNDVDVLQNVFNITTSKLTLSNAKDLTKCPKCGSRANTHKTIKYWVDKKGNCVDREE